MANGGPQSNYQILQWLIEHLPGVVTPLLISVGGVWTVLAAFFRFQDKRFERKLERLDKRIDINTRKIDRLILHNLIKEKADLEYEASQSGKNTPQYKVLRLEIVKNEIKELQK